MSADLHIVITTSRIVLVRRPGADWRALQDAFEGFMTSFGPCGVDEVMTLIDAEWPRLKTRKDAIRAFVAGADDQLDLG